MCKGVAKPFLKWAGGKGQLLNKFDEIYPQELIDGKIETYIEPFVGGGAVFFDILQRYKVKKAVIVDLNKELINCYRCIKADVNELINSLTKLENEFLALEEDKRKDYFLKVRQDYNTIHLNGKYDFEKASNFIFLNRTCFNGLYRVNSKGEFNVPFGKYKNPLICDKDNLLLISKLLQNVEIRYGDYSICKEYITDNTFIYCDPPYRPLIENKSFVNYDKNGFDDDNQKELAEFVKKLSAKGVKIMLNNSDPKNTNPEDDFFDNLYNGFEIDRIHARRMINCQADKRGDITEIVVRNYKRRKESMNIFAGRKEITVNGISTRSIIEFEFDDYILYVFPKSLSQFDILIKYKKGSKKIRTPKHVHWVVDILLKMQANNDLTRKFLLGIKNIWNTSTPLTSRNFNTIKSIVENDIQLLEIDQYQELNNYGEYPVDFLFVLMKLLSIQEKTNRADAYMFGQIIDELLEVDLDIFKIISKAGFGGRK